MHRRNLPECSRRIRRVRAGSEIRVAGQVIAMIEDVERFGEPLQFKTVSNREGTAEPRVHAEKVVAGSGVTADERSVYDGPSGGALNGCNSGCDVEWQRGIVLQHAAQLKARQ